MGEAPFFIVGSERSGTTLLMIMLGQHPRLAVPEVAWYYPRFAPYLHTYGDLRDPARFRVLVEEMVFGLKTPFFGLPVNPRTIVDEVIIRTGAPSFREVYRVMLELHAQHAGKPRWGEKTPHNLYHVRQIRQDFPGARFINLIRDGRDVAVEQLRSAFGPRTVYAAARWWWRAVRAGAAEAGAADWLDVRYEALVAEPEGQLRRILAFLGEAYHPALLDFHRSPLARRRAATRDHRPLGQPVTTSFVALYRTWLSLRDQAIFAGVAGDELGRLGYRVEVPPVLLDPDEAARELELDGRIRAATLDGPDGHIAYESYNDWLADQREARRQGGVWVGDGREDGEAELLSGQRACRRWKEHFAIKRRYQSEGPIL